MFRLGQTFRRPRRNLNNLTRKSSLINAVMCLPVILGVEFRDCGWFRSKPTGDVQEQGKHVVGEKKEERSNGNLYDALQGLDAGEWACSANRCLLLALLQRSICDRVHVNTRSSCGS